MSMSIYVYPSCDGHPFRSIIDYSKAYHGLSAFILLTILASVRVRQMTIKKNKWWLREGVGKAVSMSLCSYSPRGWGNGKRRKEGAMKLGRRKMTKKVTA